MTHNTDKVGFPTIPLTGGMQLVLEARDPTTDTEVAGVTSSRWAIYGSNDAQNYGTPIEAVPILVVPQSA